MAEFLDIYDENGNHIGFENRNIVHERGLWHKTIQVWIIKDRTKVLFQKRAAHLIDNPNKLYTTSSGHVAKDEAINQAVIREISEELGIIPSPTDLIKIKETKYSLDFLKTNGKEYHDRIFANTFFLMDNRPLTEYKPQEEELDGIIEIEINDAINLFKNNLKSISGTGFLKQPSGFKLQPLEINIENFIILTGETGYNKYGKLLEEILEMIPQN